jgi:hypothetical protein
MAARIAQRLETWRLGTLAASGRYPARLRIAIGDRVASIEAPPPFTVEAGHRAAIRGVGASLTSPVGAVSRK